MQAKGRQGSPREPRPREPKEQNENLKSKFTQHVESAQNQGESVFSDAQTIIKEISTMWWWSLSAIKLRYDPCQMGVMEKDNS